MPEEPLFDTVKFGHHMVPAIWKYMLPADVLAMTPPMEQFAVCGNCPKIRSDAYRPDYRCCTFHPKMANFLLGLATLEQGHASKNISQLCAQGFLIPEGLVATPHRWVLTLADLHENRYGKSNQVLCSFLDASNGLCSIYRFRNASCSTFFCTHDQEEIGENFWNSLLNLAAQSELALSQWAMEQLGIDPANYYSKLDDLADKIKTVGVRDTQAWSHEARKLLWGPDWFGKEFDFFKACGELVIQHKDRLWEICSAVDVRESEKFDIAAISVVPTTYHDQITDDDLVSGGITPLSDLHELLMVDYQLLVESVSKQKLT